MNNKDVVKLMLEKMLDEKVLTQNDLEKMVKELGDRPKKEEKYEEPKKEPWMKDERKKLAKSLEDGLNASGKIVEGAWDSLAGKTKKEEKRRECKDM